MINKRSMLIGAFALYFLLFSVPFLVAQTQYPGNRGNG